MSQRKKKRKTDKEIFDEWCKHMGYDNKSWPAYLHKFYLMCIKKAREWEPRINHGLHFADYLNICDDDDDFDSFYGKDYPWEV